MSRLADRMSVCHAVAVTYIPGGENDYVVYIHLKIIRPDRGVGAVSRGGGKRLPGTAWNFDILPALKREDSFVGQHAVRGSPKAP